MNFQRGVLKRPEGEWDVIMKRNLAILLCALICFGALGMNARAVSTAALREQSRTICLGVSRGVELGEKTRQAAADPQGGAVRTLAAKGVLAQDTEPTQALSREALLQMLSLYVGEKQKAREDLLHWAQAEKLIARNIGDTWSAETVTRQELAVLLYRFNKLVMGLRLPNELGISLADEGALRARTEVFAVLSAGLMKPGPDGAFSPGAQVTVGEAAQVLVRYDKQAASYRKGCAIDDLRYIPHAGGRVEDSFLYTNSLEALQETDNWGNRVVELDFLWTTDDQLICLHNWGSGLPEKCDLETFLSGKIYDRFTPIGLEQVADWLTSHPQTKVVMDFKERSVEGLQLISQKYPALLEQFIPYIYHTREYESVRGMGYENIILYLARMSGEEKDFAAMANFAREKGLVGIAMYPYTEAEIIPHLEDTGVPLLAYTVNDEQWMYELVQQGIDGFFTDLQDAMIVW